MLLDLNSPPALFRRLFEPHVRAAVDFDRLVTSATIQAHHFDQDSPFNFDDCFVGWWLDPSRSHEVEHDHSGAVPTVVGHVARHIEALRLSRVDYLRTLTASFRSQRETIQLVVPAISLDGARMFALNCSHRLAAICMSEVDYNILLFLACPGGSGEFRKIMPDITIICRFISSERVALEPASHADVRVALVCPDEQSW